MKVKGIWESGKAFRIKGHSSDYEVFTSPKDENLKKVAARSMEMILNGVVGCMGATITTIIRHHMNQIDNFEISAVGRRAEIEPKEFTHIDIYIEIEGNIQSKEIKRATNLAEAKYCPAINSVKASSSYYINLNGECI